MQEFSLSYGICTYGISVIEKKTNQMNIMIMLKSKHKNTNTTKSK